MAGVSSKEIRNRIRSMKSTRQITKAMEMVASSKLRRAQMRMQNSRPYFETIYGCLRQIAATHPQVSSLYLQSRPKLPAAVVVIAGDRGLAGGYNTNLLKKAMEEIREDSLVIPVGKKALEYLSGKMSLSTKDYAQAESLTLGDCFTIAKNLCKEYQAGTIGEVKIVYTQFLSVLQQAPVAITVLPIPEGEAPAQSSEILYEPDGETVFNTIVPEYVGGVLYGALCESRGAEQAARRNAMDAATQNADEMIEELNLKYNQARQAAITQEITEIIAGG